MRAATGGQAKKGTAWFWLASECQPCPQPLSAGAFIWEIVIYPPPFRPQPIIVVMRSRFKDGQRPTVLGWTGSILVHGWVLRILGIWDIHRHTARWEKHRNRSNKERPLHVAAVMGRGRVESHLTVATAIEAKAQNPLPGFLISRDKNPTWICLGKKGNLLADTERKMWLGRTRSKNWTQQEIALSCTLISLWVFASFFLIVCAERGDMATCAFSTKTL